MNDETVYLMECLECRDGQEAAVTICGYDWCPCWPFRRMRSGELRRHGMEILRALPEKEIDDG